MRISLSILEYEPDLSDNVDNLAESRSLSEITELIQTGKIHRVHIDVMRPPMIPNKTRFSVLLIRRLYEALHRNAPLVVHLMVKEPFPIVEQISEFVPKKNRGRMTLFIQRESFSSEEETLKTLNLLRQFGYKAGICLDLPTPSNTLTEKIIENADTVLLMTVPMGRGAQKFSDHATKRIAYFTKKFPDKTVEVDGGINPQTIVAAEKAGAKIAVVGSFITQSQTPEIALLELEQSLERAAV